MNCTHVQSCYSQGLSDFTDQYLTMRKIGLVLKNLINLKLLCKVVSIIKELHRLQHYDCLGYNL